MINNMYISIYVLVLRGSEFDSQQRSGSERLKAELTIHIGHIITNRFKFEAGMKSTQITRRHCEKHETMMPFLL